MTPSDEPAREAPPVIDHDAADAHAADAPKADAPKAGPIGAGPVGGGPGMARAGGRVPPVDRVIPPPPPLASAPPPAASTASDKGRPPVVVRGGGSNLLTIVLSAALAGGLYYVWANPQAQKDDSEALDQVRQQVRVQGDQLAEAQNGAKTLAQQMQTLADRVEKLEHAPAQEAAAPVAAAPAVAPDLGDLPKRVDDLSAKVDALASRPAPAASEAQVNDTAAVDQAVTDLGHKVADSLNAQKSDLDGQKAALAAQKTTIESEQAAVDTLAGRVEKLEHAAGANTGLGDRALHLARVQAALVALQAGEKLGDVPDAPPAVAHFAKLAPPTEIGLREAFPAVEAHARAVSRPDISKRNFWERTLTRLQQSVTVREGQDVLVGDPAAGTLEAAAEKVQADDLAGAVVILRTLQGPAAAAVQDWVDKTSALLAARAALADMAAHG